MWPGGHAAAISWWFSMSAHGMYEIDVYDQRDREQANDQPGDRQAELRAQPQPALGGAARAVERRRASPGAGGGASGPNPRRPARWKATYATSADEDEGEGERRAA